MHRNVFGPATVRTLSINILPGAVDSRFAALQGCGGWREAPLPARSGALTARAEPGRAPSLLADGFWEMVDALDAYAAPSPSPSAAPVWLRRVRDALHDCAGAAGVHPVYLARAFRRAYGVPVTEYARRLRIRAPRTASRPPRFRWRASRARPVSRTRRTSPASCAVRPA